MLKPAQLLPLTIVRAAGNDMGPGVAGAQRKVKKVDPNPRDQDRCDGYKRNKVAILRKPRPTNSALVLAKKLVYPFEGGRVDIPSVARNISDLFHAAVVGRVKTMVHARR